jgi:hypothetical protein
MCETCLGKCDNYGEIFPGWWLVRATVDSSIRLEADDWGLVQCNDPTFIFEQTPIKNPCYGLLDNELDDPDLDEPHKNFLKVAHSIAADMHESLDYSRDFPTLPLSAYGKLYVSCVEAGYKRKEHGSLLYWLCHYIATYLDNDPKIDRWADF